MRNRVRVHIVAGMTVMAFSALPGASGPARPVSLDPTAAAASTRDILKDRADTEKWLKDDPTSYLATIDRRDFGDKSMLTVGRAVDNDVRIDDRRLESHDRHHLVVVELAENIPDIIMGRQRALFLGRGF